ncbi:EF-hand and coiled-coil domain-containing protein 1 isoform X1 [Gadus macrocephalus]|uniref:EF-hand and coiled-coil domain-containing protein 1 isoform X1 n=1 Tax=Gadus macrocephalus TaxID=80720 RepID=UPI0028CBB11F|nr:EF-hand and coiled-coil domain-containing protein 1 isoform X1 [Gadus macrocephalus]
MERGSPALSRLQPPLRDARKSEWLRSALAHHHRSGSALVENEIVVLATGIDQYLQEVFHHLAHPSREDTVSAEDFTALCLVLGLQADAERRTTIDDEEEEDESRWICVGLPGELSFKEFHSRLCGYFRVRAAGGTELDKTDVKRLNFSQETELVEREIRLRCPRVRRRKCVSFDLSVDQTRVLSKAMKEKVHSEDYDQAGVEAAALRELVEDLRAALQGSDARCLSLEVALQRRSRALHHSPSFSITLSQPSSSNTSSPKPSPDRSLGGKWTERMKRAAPSRRADGDPILRELRLIRESRDGQLEEAIRFNQRLEEELGWAYQEVRRRADVESALRKENAAIRRRAEEAREAVKQGLRLIQEQAQSVPELQSTIAQLEKELQHYRSQCTHMTDTTSKGYYQMGAEETCTGMEAAEGLQRAVEGRAASDEEEEDREQGIKEGRVEDAGRCCLVEMKKFINRPHTCGQGCQNPVMRTLLSQEPLQHQKPSRSSSKDRGRGGAGQAQPEEGPTGEEASGPGAPLQVLDRSQVALLEEKVADALALLLQLRKKNISSRAVGKTSGEELCSRSRHDPAQMIQVADALCAQLQLSTNEIAQREDGCHVANEEGGGGGVATFGTHTKQSSSCQSNSRGINTLVISC